MLTLAKDLGRTLEEIMEMSTLEFKMWVAYYNMEAKDRQKQMRKGKHGRR